MKLEGQVSIKPTRNLASFFEYDSYTLGNALAFWRLLDAPRIPESTGTPKREGMSQMHREWCESISIWTTRDGDSASGCDATRNGQ